MKKTKLDGKLGPLFPPTLRFVGKIVLGAGLLSIAFIPLIGLFLFLVGGFIGFGVSGVMLYPSEALYQEYIGLFGLRYGKKKSYLQYPYLSVMRTKVTSSAYSRSNRSAVTGADLYYDVYLLSESHRERILLRRYSSQFEAKEKAQELGVVLSKKVVMYNPKVSAETQKRR
jgi:hypothetical protein